MKRKASFISVYFLLSAGISTALASSVITLSGGGVIAPATNLNLSLNGLVPTATYSVVCYIDTTYSFQYIRFGSQFSAPTSTITSFSLNGNYVTQDQLLVGHNIAVIEGTFTNPSTDKIIFSNLDQVNSFNINNCFAISKGAL